MLDKMDLPPLHEFHEALQTLNIRKSYQYLLYFVKSQQQIYDAVPEAVPIDLNLDLVPTPEHRNCILRKIGDIMYPQASLKISNAQEENKKTEEALVISAQRVILSLFLVRNGADHAGPCTHLLDHHT